MGWLTTYLPMLKQMEPIITISLGLFSFILGFVGGMLKQKYKEGAIKGEIDAKIANCDRRITNAQTAIADLRDSVSAWEAKQTHSETVAQERASTRKVEIISEVKELINDQFIKLEARLMTMLEASQNNTQTELASVICKLDSKLSQLIEEIS